MAVYKLFAEKDTTLYSEYSTLNSGLDPILELNKDYSILFPSHSTAARILIKFSSEDIADVIDNKVGNSNYDAYLRLNLADAGELPLDYTLITHPVYESWDMGTGRYGLIPIVSNGASWIYRNSEQTNAWLTGSYPADITGYYDNANPGGGTWYSNYSSEQSFNYHSNKDINFKVTDIVDAFYYNDIVNNGFIIKTSGSVELDPNYLYKLNYFSRDTNTIYPPVLEIRWDDYVFATGSNSMGTIDSVDAVVTLANNKEIYNNNSIQKFRINCRRKYPVRVFSTTSLYTFNKYLTEGQAYYCIKDLNTDMTIVDFDENYTKISADEVSSYFTVYMDGLEPERYYKVLIKVIIDGSTIIFDDDYYFKVKK
jgi:hypothetical protein